MIDGTYDVGPDPLLDMSLKAEETRRFHHPGDRYVRAMLVVQEVDKDGNPLSKPSAAHVTRRVGVLALAQCAGRPMTDDLMTQHAAAALHQLIRGTPQGAIVHHFEKVLAEGG